MIMNDFDFTDYIRNRVKEVKIWFVDIPRTGSTSIKASLASIHGRVFGKYGVRQGVKKGLISDHTTALEMRDLLGEDIWEDIFSFAFVRNPWDRMVSLYLYRTQIEQVTDMTFKDYVVQLCKHGPESHYLFDFHAFHYENWQYVCNDKGEQIVDFVGKYENRSEDLKTVSECTNISYQYLIKHKYSVTDRTHYSEYYDDETRQLIAERYARDIELFDYQF